MLNQSVRSRKIIIDIAYLKFICSIFVFIASFLYPMRLILSVLCILVCNFFKNKSYIIRKAGQLMVLSLSINV